MRVSAVLLALAASSATAQPVQPPPPAEPWQPTARYVEIGQDEPGYRNWYMAAPWHPTGVATFHNYLAAAGVAGIVPTWQLLRTASDWNRCRAQAFEIPPASEWANIVQALRFVRDKVIPRIGPVEPVSVYRNPMLNTCAGGAKESAHRYGQALDMVPLRPTSREALIRDLCAVHAEDGRRYGVGLGFYAFLRFHIDSRSFRKWGFADTPEATACLPPAPNVERMPMTKAVQPAAAAKGEPPAGSATN